MSGRPCAVTLHLLTVLVFYSWRGSTSCLQETHPSSWFQKAFVTPSCCVDCPVLCGAVDSSSSVVSVNCNFVVPT